MTKMNFDIISNALRDARTVGVASHIRPDADALGSTIAFALWLRDCGKEVTAYNEEGSTAKFHYLPCHEIVSLPPATPQKFDVFVALDTSVKNRLGTVNKAIAPGTTILNIDHHISNENYGDVNFIDASAPATGQILLEFFQHVGACVSAEMATNLFAAISTDTGSFQYAGTNERTRTGEAREPGSHDHAVGRGVHRAPPASRSASIVPAATPLENAPSTRGPAKASPQQRIGGDDDTATTGSGRIVVGVANFQRCTDRSTIAVFGSPSIHGLTASMSTAATSSGGTSKCSRLKRPVACTVRAGTGEMPLRWLSATQATGPAASPPNWIAPGSGRRLGRSSTSITVKHGS